MKEPSFKTLMNRLARAGFKKDFVRSAILPDWWDDSCAEDISLLQDTEIRVARFLGLPLSVVKGVGKTLRPYGYPEARLRGARVKDPARLVPAIYSAMQIASAVIRNLKDDVAELDPPPSDGFVWRDLIKRSSRHVTLEDIAVDLWNRGIPIIPLEVLPSPSFQGMAGVIEGRPFIIVAYKHDEPGRIAFLLAHEVGHITAGDCAPGKPVVDVDDNETDFSVSESAEMNFEFLADKYATRVVIGGDTIPDIHGLDFKQLASQAVKIERETGADAGAIIFAWARRTKRAEDYQKATRAIQALYRATGARNFLSELFKNHVDLTTASESDHGLLQCVYSGLEADEATL